MKTLAVFALALSVLFVAGAWLDFDRDKAFEAWKQSHHCVVSSNNRISCDIGEFDNTAPD